jgi:hypothetical protein
MYTARLRRNIMPVVAAHGFPTSMREWAVDCVSWRHVWNVSKGRATITVDTLQQLAEEIGADFLDFFAE